MRVAAAALTAVPAAAAAAADSAVAVKYVAGVAAGFAAAPALVTAAAANSDASAAVQAVAVSAAAVAAAIAAAVAAVAGFAAAASGANGKAGVLAEEAAEEVAAAAAGSKPRATCCKARTRALQRLLYFLGLRENSQRCSGESKHTNSKSNWETAEAELQAAEKERERSNCLRRTGPASCCWQPPGLDEAQQQAADLTAGGPLLAGEVSTLSKRHREPDTHQAHLGRCSSSSRRRRRKAATAGRGGERQQQHEEGGSGSTSGRRRAAAAARRAAVGFNPTAVRSRAVSAAAFFRSAIMAFSPTTAAARAAEAAQEGEQHGVQPQQQRHQQQQHSSGVRAVAAEAAAAAGTLFDGSLKERLAQMLLLLQEDDPPPQQQQQQHVERRVRGEQGSRRQPRSSTRAARQAELHSSASYSSSSSSSSSSSKSSEGEGRGSCSKCRKLQQRLQLERLRRRAEDGEAKQLIARVAAQVTRLSRDAREAAAAAAAAAATASHERQKQHLEQQQQLLQEERRRCKALEEQLRNLQSEVESRGQQAEGEGEVESADRSEIHYAQLQLLQQQMSLRIQQFLGQADPKLQLLLLRLERMGLQLQQLQHRQERRQQLLLVQQQRLLQQQLQQQGQLYPPQLASASPSPASLGQPLRHQELIAWPAEALYPGNAGECSFLQTAAWAGRPEPASGISGPHRPLGLRQLHDQLQQHEQLQQHAHQETAAAGLARDEELSVTSQQSALHARPDLSLHLPGPLLPQAAASPSCCHSCILTPAAAFARAAAAAEGVTLGPPSEEPQRRCSCSCSGRLKAGSPALQQRACRQRSSLLSNASVGRRGSEAFFGHLVAGAAAFPAAAAAAAVGADLGAYSPPIVPNPALCLLMQQRHSGAAAAAGRVYTPLPPAAEALSRPSASLGPSDIKQVAAPQDGGSLAALPAVLPPAAAAAHALSVAFGQQSITQGQQEEAPLAQPESLGDVRAQPAAQSVAVTADPCTQHRPQSGNRSSGILRHSGVPPCSYPSSVSPSQLHGVPVPPSQSGGDLLALQVPDGRHQQQSVLVLTSKLMNAGLQDWRGGACHSEEPMVARWTETLPTVEAVGQCLSRTFAEEALTNPSILTDGTAQPLQSDNTQQQLTQSFTGSVSSTDFQQLTALQVPLRQLLNDQQALLDKLDADFKEASLVAPTGRSGLLPAVKREAVPEQPPNAQVQKHSVDERLNQGELEVTVSVPMSFSDVDINREIIREQHRLRPPPTAEGGG
ncbi:hypothetical protein Efla_005836 [Eimeria flavescens]